MKERSFVFWKDAKKSIGESSGIKNNRSDKLSSLSSFKLENSNNLDSSLSNHKIIHPKIYFDATELLIINDSIFFQGYMIFKFKKNYLNKEKITDSNFIEIDIFWINNLANIENIDSTYLVTTPTLMYQVFIDIQELKDSTNDIHKLRVFYDKYKKSINRNSVKIPFLRRSLTTKIFHDTVNFWNLSTTDSIGYYIFKTSFYASYLIGSFSYISREDNTNQEEIKLKNARILIPITPDFYFYPADNFIILNSGFKKSNWKPKFF